MRRYFWISAAAFVALASGPAAAQVTLSDNYPFCLRSYVPFGGYSECRYFTYAQCQASASGRGAMCFENPFFDPGPPPPRKRVRRNTP